jgi:DNA-binding transcriptional MerR regulator
MEKTLPAIPAKRYFTIGEVSDLCGVKPYVLRYWEQEFTQLKPMKRRGNRRYYQHHEVLLIRRIRELLYEQGFTISGARNRLIDLAGEEGQTEAPDGAAEAEGPSFDVSHVMPANRDAMDMAAALAINKGVSLSTYISTLALEGEALTPVQVREELLSIRELLNT